MLSPTEEGGMQEEKEAEGGQEAGLEGGGGGLFRTPVGKGAGKSGGAVSVLGRALY